MVVSGCITEVISIPCGGISGQQLFEYMRNHDKGYGMRTIYMASSVFDITPETPVRTFTYFISTVCSYSFSALTLLVGGRKGIRPVKNSVVGCWHGYLSGARCRLAYVPADATATHCLLLQ